tara:strand:+ start:3877 stop:9561 length:5685 start_codon:yes stop_codon:yes gene_type:complete
VATQQDPVASFVGIMSDNQIVDNNPEKAGLYSEYTPLLEEEGYEFDPVKRFQQGFESGGYAVAANANYFRAIFNSLADDEQGVKDAIAEGAQAQETSAAIKENVPTFEQFLDEPTFTGFLEQSAMISGEVIPSALASITAALVGTATAAITTAASGGTAAPALAAGTAAAYTGLSSSIAANAATKKIIKTALRKKLAKEQLEKPEEEALELLYKEYKRKAFQRNLKMGGASGAFTQEYVQGGGTFFGNFAEQGMTDPVQAFQSLGLAVPFAIAGTGSDIAIAKAFQKAASRGTGTSFLGRVGESVVRGSVAEGLAESAQQEIEIAQKSRIDSEYTAANKKLDRITSLFSGVIGGGAVSGGLSTPAAVVGQARSYMKNAFEDKAETQETVNLIGQDQVGEVFEEPSEWIEGQFDTMMDATTTKDSVWVDANSYKSLDKVANKLGEKYPNLFLVELEGIGTLYTSNKEKAQEFTDAMSGDTANTELMESELAKALGYSSGRTAGDGLAVEIRDSKNNLVWYQETSKAGKNSAEKAAEKIVNNSPGYTIQVRSKEDHLLERAALRKGKKDVSAMEEDFDEDQDLAENRMETDGDSVLPGFEDVNIYNVEEPTILEEGYGSDRNPILPKQTDAKKSGGWPVATTKNVANKDLAGSVLLSADPTFRSVIEKNIKDGKYSVDLLNRYVKESKLLGAGEALVIQEAEGKDGTTRYVIKKARMPKAEVNVKQELGLAVEIARDNKGARNSPFTISQNGGAQRELNMPFLTNFYGERALKMENLFKKGQQELEQKRLSFDRAFSDILLSENYDLLFKGKPITDQTFKDKDFIIYTKDEGRTKYSYTQTGARSDVQRGQATAVFEEDIQYQIDAAIAKLPFKPQQEARALLKLMGTDLQEPIGVVDKLKVLGVDLEALGYDADTSLIRTAEQSRDAEISRENEDIAQLQREKGQVVEDQDITSKEYNVTEQIDAEYETYKGQPISYLSRNLGDPTKAGGIEVSKSVEQDLGIVGVTNSFLNLAKEKLGIKKEIRVYNPREEVNTGNKNFDQQIAKHQELLSNDNTKKGFNIEGADFDVVILNTKEVMSSAGKGYYLHALGHEIGHTFVRQELETSLKNPKLRNKLLEAYNSARAKVDVGQYSDYDNNNGFEEWMSDQVSAYLIDEAKKAEDQVGSFFKRMANKLKAFAEAYSNKVKERFSLDPAFSEYVLELSNIIKIAPPVKYENKVIIENIKQKLESTPIKQKAKVLQKTVDKLIKDGKAPVGLTKLFYTADGLVRKLGPAGVAIGQFFYSRSSSTDATGFLTAKNSIGLAKLNQIQKILGIEKASELTEEKMNILYEVEDETIATENLSTPEAKALREWLSNHYDELNLQSLGLQKGKNFFPRVISVVELISDPDKKQTLIDILVKNNKGKTFTRTKFDKDGKPLGQEQFTVNEKEATKIVEDIMKDPSQADTSNTKQKEEEFSVGIVKHRAETFKTLTTKELRKEGLIEDPQVAIQRYVDNSVKRAEFEKRGGTVELQRLVNEIKDPKSKRYAKESIDAMLGRVDPIQNNFLRGANQFGLMANVFTLLTFSVFASFPDLAGPILRSKELKAFGTTWNTIKATIKDPAEAEQLAKDIGVIGIDAMTTTFVNAGELDYASETTKKYTNKFFRAIGLEQFTKFTRVFAAGMGKSFLLDHGKRAKAGDAQSQRYLKQLDVTSAEIEAWAGGDVNAAGNAKVRLALARFVDESIVRPNSAERPTWASDPKFALVWQLKSFYYAYGKNIIGGSMRETAARWDEAGLAGASVPLFMAAATLLPLTMLGFDLRERFKVASAWLLPGISPQDKDYRRSQSMDWGEYNFEILDRSGVLGPFALALPLFMEEKRYGDPFWVGPLGPTAEKSYDFFTGDLDIQDLTPFYSVM